MYFFCQKLNPIDTGRKLNVHKTFRRSPGRLLNVLYTFNLRSVSTGKCKEHFYNEAITTDEIQQEEVCHLNTKFQKRYFNSNDEATESKKIFKKEATELLKKPNCQQSNLTAEERHRLKYLSENRNLIIKGAGEGEKTCYHRHWRLC